MEIDNIVNNNLCTGCGVCISEDDSKTAKMIWNKYGFLVPRTTVKSNQFKMIDVCPFKINQLNEDELAIKFIKENDTIFNSKIGHHRSLYAGYSKKFRETSSSGGLATFVFEKLISKIKSLEKNNQEIKVELTKSAAVIQSQSNEIEALKVQYDTLKIANSLLGSDDNKRDTKLKINSLIREIDYCIAQLSD